MRGALQRRDRPRPRPPLSLRALPVGARVGGDRGRALFGVLDTVVDAQLSALETLYAGYAQLQGGGLRDGSFSASGNAVRLRLHGYAFVPDLRVSGSLASNARARSRAPCA